jgi:peptidyl-prolyl cis-trans isomerase D
MAEIRPAIWIRNIALGGVILAFVVFFGMPSQTPGPNAVAHVGGENISRDVFEFFRQQNENQSRPFLPKNLEANQIRDLLDRQTLDGLVRRYVLAQEAAALGLRVTDAEVREEILADESFRLNGRFDRDSLERFANQLGSMRDYTEEVRRDLMLRKLQRVVASPQRVPESEARRRATQELTQLRLRYARASAERMAEEAELGPDEVRAFADAEPERVETLYRRRLHEFQAPEQVHARHVLFTGDDAAERARATRARIEAGEDFAELARELSQDLATREEGGDLGFFPRGRVLPALEQAAFALEAGQVSDLVETDRGVHLVRIDERRAASERSLEEVRFELARELLAADSARDQARQAAAQFLDAMRAGTPFDEAAATFPVEIELTPLFAGRDPLPGELARIPGVRAALFGLELGAPVERVFEAGDDFFVVWVAEREEADPADVESHALRIRERLEGDARGRVLAQWYRQRMQELQRSGDLEFYPLYPTTG